MNPKLTAHNSAKDILFFLFSNYSFNVCRRSNFGFLLLVHNLDHIHNKCLELSLRDLPIAVGIQLFQDIVNVLLGWFLHVEGISQSLEELTQLVPFDCAGVVGVKGVESVFQFFLCNVKGLLETHMQ